MPACDVLYYDPAQVGQVRRTAGQALGPVSDGWQPCSAPGQVWTDPGQVLRFVCHPTAASSPPCGPKAWPTASAGPEPA
jgi:hypothetical protein